jgi:hypothetical protein
VTEGLGTMRVLDHVRQNHALEHAAISVVTERHPTVFLSGRSNRRGFYIFGAIGTAELQSAIDEALTRLRAGEAYLAIHPRCGTNLAVAGILAGLAASATGSIKPASNRVMTAILASIGALMVAPRLGASVQQHVTTLADVGGLTVSKVEQRHLPFVRVPVHWVETRWAS